MTSKKKKIIKIIAILTIVGVLIGGAVILYMFNMPHRDVQNSDTDHSLTTTQLVAEYLTNSDAANEKYLADDGNSKILEVTGTVKSISTNFNNETVVLLQETADKAGVNCVFLADRGDKASKLKIGSKTKIKGVIRQGAAYDEDLEFYEHVIIDKCDLIENK